jgi:hydroxymethylglutaryl-CoA lyase
MPENIKIIECPRDAMQGWKEFIPTRDKIDYLNLLLKAGFDTLDFGSFVSHKTIPQLKDTAEVLSGLELQGSATKLLAIVANLRGARDACAFDEISYLGFPFSVSEEFQKRNTNSTIAESLKRVEEIQHEVSKSDKKLVIYISMGFGNPYGEPWSAELVSHWVKRLAQMGISIIALSDTIGVSNPDNINRLFSHLIPEIPEVEFGAHLHSHRNNWMEKVSAAYASGCRRFDSAMKGVGGCPMANDELVGNLATEDLVSFFSDKVDLKLNAGYFNKSLAMAAKIFHV